MLDYCSLLSFIVEGRHYLTRIFSVANFANLGTVLTKHSSQASVASVPTRKPGHLRISSSAKFAPAQAYAELKIGDICSLKALLISLLSRSGVVISCVSSWPNTWSIYARFPAHPLDIAMELTRARAFSLFPISYSRDDADSILSY